MKCSEFHKLILKNGWLVLRQTGSHIIYVKGNKTYPVPYHGTKELGKGIERKMRKDMNLK